MSGLLGQILGRALGGSGSSGDAGSGRPFMAVLQQVLASNGGGVAALLSRFESVGLGSQAQSWVGAGQNAPLTAEQIEKVFSADEIQSWAQQAGTTPDKLKAVLAEAVPHAVDHATPGGIVPQAGQMPDLSGLVSRFLSGGAQQPQQPPEQTQH